MRQFQPQFVAFCCSIVFFTAIRGETPAIREMKFTSQHLAHWAFQPLSTPSIPSSTKLEFQHPIDSFLTHRQKILGIHFSPLASRPELIRRATWDLLGALPTPTEVTAFQEDTRPNAYPLLLDRLLADPRYGERQAQFWLDLVRFAETNGYEVDGDRPQAWRYRDYVIDSFNRNKPFDQFLFEQIAGDEITVHHNNRKEALIATAFHRCGPQHIVSGNIDPEVARQEVLTEMVTGVSAAFLGLTVHCARCHDHKFDPISQADYYRLEAFFANTKQTEINQSTPGESALFQANLITLSARIAPLKNQVSALDAPYRERLRAAKIAKLPEATQIAVKTAAKDRTAEQAKVVKDAEADLKISWDEIVAVLSPEDRQRRDKLRQQQFALEAQLPLPPGVLSVIQNDKPVPTYLLKRGDVKKKGAVVTAEYPKLLQHIGPKAEQKTRSDLARWLIDPQHPLTARVFVNRIWAMHFGHGIVRTLNDFGLNGAKPTQPELLDWLAQQLIQSGWDIKSMHRLMMTSNAYQQKSGSAANPQAIARDPNNDTWARLEYRRHQGESLRDAMAQLAGLQSLQFGGRSVRVPLEPEVYELIFTEGEPDGLWPITPDSREHHRRSIYLFMKRNVRLPIFEAFDLPDRLTPCAERNRSTFAPQALILMNGPIARNYSRAFASRLIRELGSDDKVLVQQLYMQALARMPSEQEQSRALAFLQQQARYLKQQTEIEAPSPLPMGTDVAKATALADLCLAVFNLNEFVYIP